MEAVKCNKIKIIVLILSALFLIGGCAFGQIGRQEIYNPSHKINTTNRYTLESLWFKLPNSKDTLFLGLSSDSLGNGAINFSVFATFPKRMNVDFMTITVCFKDGTEQEMKQELMDADNYVEFVPTGDINEFVKKQITHVKFKDIGRIKTNQSTYFMDFFSYL